MVWLPCAEPNSDFDCGNDVEIVIVPRTGDIGNFEVRRALPFRKKRMVEPFIFWDQMGPGEFLDGQGIDVQPHPHIGLSTVTYLLNGSLDHKDSLGANMRIKPGRCELDDCWLRNRPLGAHRIGCEGGAVRSLWYPELACPAQRSREQEASFRAHRGSRFSHLCRRRTFRSSDSG